jgi:hypothetical protein
MCTQHNTRGLVCAESSDGLTSCMRPKLLFVFFGILFTFIAAPLLCADQVEMRNGDHYSGQVLSVSTDTVVLESDVLGGINLPRKNVTSIAFGANSAAPKAANNIARVSAPTNHPAAAPMATLANTNVDLSAALRKLGGNTNFVGQIREQMLAGNPEAGSKFDEMVNGLISGKLNLNDLRREAQSSADQLRSLKSDLGPEAGDSLDVYLDVLDNFLKETAAEPGNATPGVQPRSQVH